MDASRQIHTPLDRAIFLLIEKANNKMFVTQLTRSVIRSHNLDEDAVVCKLLRMIKAGKLFACIDACDQSVILSIPRRK